MLGDLDAVINRLLCYVIILCYVGRGDAAQL